MAKTLDQLRAEAEAMRAGGGTTTSGSTPARAETVPKDLEGERNKLIAGGFLPFDPTRIGLWGDPERSAQLEAVQYQQNRGLSSLDEAYAQRAAIMQQAAATQRRSTSGGRGAAPLVRLTNPNDIRELADVVAQRKIGRKVSPEILDQIIAGINAEERKVGGGSSGTVVDPQSAETAVSTFLQTNMQGEYEATNVANTVNDFIDILGGVV